jgi:hypothetical protein
MVFRIPFRLDKRGVVGLCRSGKTTICSLAGGRKIPSYCPIAVVITSLLELSNAAADHEPLVARLNDARLL